MVQRAAKRIPVIAGTGANSTREAIELTQLAKDAGADACLMVTPYYNKPTQEGLFQHYKAVAERVAVPIVLYNVPSRTGCDIKPETVERLPRPFRTSSASRKRPRWNAIASTSRASAAAWRC